MAKQPEAVIQDAILKKWGADPRIRLWRASVLVGVPWGIVKAAISLLQKGQVRRAIDLLKGGIQRAGLPGQADLSGILPDGRRLEVEVKTPTGRQHDDQKVFERVMTEMGGVYILARSVDDVDSALEPILKEIARDNERHGTAAQLPSVPERDDAGGGGASKGAWPPRPVRRK